MTVGYILLTVDKNMGTTTPHTRWQRFLAEMRSTYKSMDTEEKWDIYVVRPIGFVEACFCRWLHIHPNAITIVSIIFGAASGYFFFPGNRAMVLIGALMLFFANTLDSADGQLARMTKQYTMLGRVLDGFAGDVWFFSIYLFMLIRMYTLPIPLTSVPWGILGVSFVAVCGLHFHSTQTTIADYYQNKGYLIDTHTAVAVNVMEQYRAATGDETVTVFVSTASPYKFCDHVLAAVGHEPAGDGVELLDQLHEVSGVAVPRRLAELRGKERRFHLDCQKQEMENVVLNFLK